MSGFNVGKIFKTILNLNNVKGKRQSEENRNIKVESKIKLEKLRI